MAPRLPVCGSAQSWVPRARGPGLPPSRNRPHAPEGRRGPGRLAVGSRDTGASRRGAARFSSAPAGSGAPGAAGGGCSAVWGPPRRHVGATATPGCHSSRKPGQVSRFKLTPSSESPLRWGRPHRGRSHSSCHPCPPRGTWSRRRPPGRRGRPCREAPASLCGILQLLLSPTKGRDVLALYIYHAHLSSSLPSRLSENPFPYPAVAAVNKASRLRASP